jgi:hypothetical protein
VLVAACGIAALICIAPTLLVLAGFVGLVPFDMNMLFVALPTLGVAVGLAVVGRGALGDLLLPRPVLSADETMLFDRRVMIEPLPWSEVTRATSVVAGGGGVVLDLRNPIPTFGMGSIVFETPDPGIAHIAVRGMTQPADVLARALLDLAAEAGAETGEARAHEKLRRRSWSV